MPKRTVPIKIEIPLDLAEILVRDGDRLLRVLEDLIAQAKRGAKSEDWRRRQDNVRRKRREREAKFQRDGRVAHRALRHLLPDVAEDLRGKDRIAARKLAIQGIAADLGFSFDYAEMAIRKHRGTVLRRARERRKLWVLRYLLEGLSTPEITRRVKVTQATVAKDIRELRAEARKSGQSLTELERELTARRQAEVPARDQDNVIDWAEIKAARGGGRV